MRLRDANDYYLLRANALEDNVRFYKVEKGVRKQLASADRMVSAGEWHVLALSAIGNRFEVRLDREMLFEVEDGTFVEAGKVALWTKADSVTAFDDLTIVVR